MIDERALLSKHWDFIVVGTGIGGGTVGHALSQAGKSVLFLERGRYYVGSNNALTGAWLEALVEPGADGPTDEEKRRGGRFTGTITDASKPQKRELQPTLGIGAGGSSALYGMVMERLFPCDFTPAQHYPHAWGANIPEKWPISFEELSPYYAKAEALYGVRATRDPLRPAQETRSIRPPPAFTANTAELSGHLEGNGLHPYHVPVACEYLAGCLECVGFICPRGCKNDSVSVCVRPAVETLDAGLLSECDVETLDHADGRISAVNASWRGETIRLHGETIILAAGAVHTPAILLRSGGLGNGSDQVGRNLMRHLVDYYIVRTRQKYEDGPQKQLALNDFYLTADGKLGTIQSNGRMPPADVLAAGFRETLQEKWWPLGRLFPFLRGLVKMRIERLLAGSHALVSFLEDLPYASNRITLSDDNRQLTLHYRISPHDLERLAVFRQKIAAAFKPLRISKIFRAHENRVLGHVCGTCRFGDDPATSVLNRDNRAHEIANLYIVDASFFPTSGGVNPSLTIAANALRVADRILGRG